MQVEAAAHTRYRSLEKKYEQLMAASIEGADAVAVATHEEVQRLRHRVQTLQAILDAERGRRPSSGLAGMPSDLCLCTYLSLSRWHCLAM